MLTLIRGLPNTGKSTLAQSIRSNTDVRLETDQFFIHPHTREYCFDMSYLLFAHQWTRQQCKMWLNNRYNVIVSNTFTAFWEIAQYCDLLEGTNISLRIIERTVVKGDNKHNVPVQTIERMKQRWQTKEYILDAINIIYPDIVIADYEVIA